MPKKIALLLLFALISSSLPLSVSAATQEYESNPEFNGNSIVTDRDFTDTNAMTLEQIQAFMRAKGGKLADYIDPTNGLTAAFIVFNAARDYGISPKVLLTLLQKEQSLVEDPDPIQSQYDWATGYSCYAGTCDEEYRGFDKQVRGAAKRFMIGYWPDLVQTGCSFTNWCVGVAKQAQDGWIITPANKATAALYTYNPYRGNSIMDGLRIGANYNFWKIWQRWFGRAGYPDGSLLKATDSPKVYIIKNGQRRWITSFATLATRYDVNLIIEAQPQDLAAFPEGDPIKFPLYALVKTPNGSIYLIADEEKRMIVSWEVFRSIGFNPEEVEDISFTDLNGIPSGKAITLYDSYPTGALLQDKAQGGVYYVESGIKYPILDEAVMKSRFGHLQLTAVSSDILAELEESTPVKFKDGVLVKANNDPTVYVIANGQRRVIPSESVFNSFGYKWHNIVVTSPEALALHPLGDTLSIAIK
ncbi:MAG: hypothetical protein NUV82_04105 [Candidatus Komeilibacteria bacterium]|nr:hypothetical protein [Candidatus Komeilibacteria bacterium]